MQYPTLDLKPLKGMFREFERVVFVENKENFVRAVAQTRYADIFRDRFQKTWGHCTTKGDRLVAENVRDALINSGAL